MAVSPPLVTACCFAPYSSLLTLALSRDVDTGSCHRASDALRRYKSGTGLTSGITSAAPGIILVIAALSLIHCQTFGGNDDERKDCAQLFLIERRRRPMM